MSDLRAAVEGLPTFNASRSRGPLVEHHAVLALIPEGEVLVTEAELAAAMHTTWPHDRVLSADHCSCERRAAAILRHLREGT